MKPMASWPKSKVIESPAFEHTGLDYFRPLLHQAKQRKKAWVCTFTCITLGAINLELLEDMTLEQFLLALRRFVARRGKSNEIILDNAPHFKVTKNTIDILWENIISDPSIHISTTKG